MQIGENGSLSLSSVDSLSNDQIVWLYLSLRSSYIARKEEYRKKMKQLEGLEIMMRTMMDDEDQSETVKKLSSKVQELKAEGEEFPEDKYVISICEYLKPRFYLIKGADEELIDTIVKDCFNEGNKALQKVLAETEDNA